MKVRKDYFTNYTDYDLAKWIISSRNHTDKDTVKLTKIALSEVVARFLRTQFGID